MLDGVPVDHLVGYGSGWAIVCIFVIAILTGKLIPKSSHEREMAQCNSELLERRTEGRAKDEIIRIQAEQLHELEEVGRSVADVMRALQGLLRRGGPTRDGGQ